MTLIKMQTTETRSARVRAALARMTNGAVFELPSTTMRGHFEDVSKVIAWRKDNGDLELRTWDESSHKGPTRWSLDAEGRLFDGGMPTVWWIYDLRFTGENAMVYVMQALPDDDDDDDVETSHGRIIPLRRVSEQTLR